MNAKKLLADGSLRPEPSALGLKKTNAVEQKPVGTPLLQPDATYWKRQLLGAFVLNLPTDKPRPAGSVSHFTWGSSRVPRDVSERLREFSLNEHLPLSSVLLSAFHVLLLRYTAQEDVTLGCSVVGSPASEPDDLSRSQQEFVLRTDLSGDPPFRVLLKRVNASTLEALAHSSFSLQTLVRELAEDPNLNNPIFQVSFSYRTSTPEVAPQRTWPTPQIAGVFVDLHLEVEESREDFQLRLLYNADLFEATSIDRTLRNLQTLLIAVAENPDQQLSRLPILTEAERQQVLVEWNQTARDYPHDKCLHELVEAQAERVPERVAVICENRELTYRELNSRANQLAHYLRTRGVGPNVRVGICLEPSFDFAVAVLAVLKSGGAGVPLDPNYPQERLAYMLQDVEAKLLVTQKETLPGEAPAGCELLFLSDKSDVVSSQPRTNPSSAVAPGDTAYVIYTSGSTGKPRGVLLTHAGLVNYNANMGRFYSVTPNDRVLQFCSISFDIALEEIFITWLSGATLIFRTEQMPIAVPEFLAWVERQQITVLDLPTAYWHEWVHDFPELKEPVPHSLRLVIVGGEKASAKAYATWSSVVGGRTRWVNTYGPTEASIAATVFEPRSDTGSAIPEEIPIGRPVANVRIYLLDRHLNPVPVGVPGELHIGGVGVAKGYFNRPELTAQKFIPDPFSSPPARLYNTGDLARYLPSGEIEFLGRRDDQIKIRGFRIELGEIEAGLAKHPSVREVAVIAIADVSGDKRLVVYLVPAPGARPTTTDLRDYLQQQLPDYMVPSVFIVLQSMPLTPNGKINRRGLPAPEIEASPDQNAVATDALQSQLVKIWEDVLGRKRIGIRDNFFELGGHSLLAARLMHKTGLALGKMLPLAMLFEAPTIEQLATVLRHDGWSIHWSSLVPIQTAGSKPPFFCVHGVGGNVLGFGELAGLMSPEYPFYGLQAQGLDGKRPCFTRIEEMAAHYIQEIKTVQPEGPYFIGGYSLGGLVAYEMARQFSASGEPVGLLVLLDTYVGKLRSISSFVARLLDRSSHQGLFRDFLKRARESVRRRFRGVLLSRVLKNVLWSNQTAADCYVLRPYDGKVTLFRASEASYSSYESLYSAWTSLAVGGLEVQQIVGHHGDILVKPQVDLLAAKLKACIDANGRSSSVASLPGLHGEFRFGLGNRGDSVKRHPVL
jgi:amino acid adenylation domain-containing protein